VLSVLLLSASLTAASKRAALVVANVANKGYDTLLYNSLENDLEYNVHWITPDTVAIRTPVYFDTAFDVVIWCGNEVAIPAPSANADTVAKSRVGFVSLLSENWNEVNLGINSDGTNGRTAENAGFVRAINRNHWITRVLQDTVLLWAPTSVAIYGLAFPDTFHNITPLIIDKDNTGDTAFVHLAAADSGETIINTGDGNNIAKGRRAFLGLFTVTQTQRDSCQFYTIFTRTVAWAARDTLNHFITHNACFSGWIEIEDAFAENSSGTDSLESYGGWSDLYTGFDFDPKVTFMKIQNDAMQRKLWQPSPVVEQFKVRTKVKQVANDAEDSLWESTNGINLLKLLWKCGRATGQTTTDYVSWIYRYKQSPNSYRWNIGGAWGLNSDVVDTVLDSLHQSRSNTATGTVLTWSIPPQYAVRMMNDTLNNHGWVWHNYWNNQNGQFNDAEIIYYSSEESAIANRPQIRVRLSSYGSSARRRCEIIGAGLIGD
jgi:hypothetical protein